MEERSIVRKPYQNTSKPQAPAPRYYQNTSNPQAPTPRYYQNRPLPLDDLTLPILSQNRSTQPGHVARYCRVRFVRIVEEDPIVTQDKVEEEIRMDNGTQKSRPLLYSDVSNSPYSTSCKLYLNDQKVLTPFRPKYLFHGFSGCPKEQPFWSLRYSLHHADEGQQPGTLVRPRDTGRGKEILLSVGSLRSLGALQRIAAEGEQKEPGRPSPSSSDLQGWNVGGGMDDDAILASAKTFIYRNPNRVVLANFIRAPVLCVYGISGKYFRFYSTWNSVRGAVDVIFWDLYRWSSLANFIRAPVLCVYGISGKYFRFYSTWNSVRGAVDVIFWDLYRLSSLANFIRAPVLCVYGISGKYFRFYSTWNSVRGSVDVIFWDLYRWSSLANFIRAPVLCVYGISGKYFRFYSTWNSVRGAVDVIFWDLYRWSSLANFIRAPVLCVYGISGKYFRFYSTWNSVRGSVDVIFWDLYRWSSLANFIRAPVLYSPQEERKHIWRSYTPGSAAPNNSLQVRRMSNGHTFLHAYVMVSVLVSREGRASPPRCKLHVRAVSIHGHLDADNSPFERMPTSSASTLLTPSQHYVSKAQ
ncbi:hypothetical protein LAZ67_4001562 [Cordylochernes scorpioides]|uniref:Uncharacterized protein n=1 Tax=Cordylochernes scorpioides TaxID=51811 RepID=A0ABY6KGT2_9ARAC|nr:hypothetical protein LAZ67_4001562 [Cordylochernes scorpioides]